MVKPVVLVQLTDSHIGAVWSGPAVSRGHYATYVALRRTLTRSYGRSTTRSFGYASRIWVQLFSRSR